MSIHNVSNVLILILLEDTLRDIEITGIDPVVTVLILILLEDTLRAEKTKIYSLLLQS